MNITITENTKKLLTLLKKELIEIYWEKEEFEKEDNLILFLINYYYKK